MKTVSAQFGTALHNPDSGYVILQTRGNLNMTSSGCDVLVVGAGNAALCAALTATEAGASVGGRPVLFELPRRTRLMSGAVFGRIAGNAAARAALARWAA